MNILKLLLLFVLCSTNSYAASEVSEEIWIGKKIYDRFYGRGCATCHDISTNPNLADSINNLSKKEFHNVLIHGKKGMPAAMNQITNMRIIKKFNYSDEDAFNAIYSYIKGRSNGTVPEGKLKRIK
jgi:mono/diheme cytochrome c family protein